MSLLNLFAAARNEAAATPRKARLACRPMMDSLEKREVFTAGIAAPFFGPVAVPPVAAVSSASTTPPSTTTIINDQRGTAFGMSWRAVYDKQIGQFRLDIQGGSGSGNVTITRTKVGIQFNSNQFNSSTGTFQNVQVVGPALELNSAVKIRQFTASGTPKLALGTGLYMNLTTTPQTQRAFVTTPSGPMEVDYTYDCVANTGVVTVHNLKGSGTFVYTKAHSDLNTDDNNGVLDSPTSDPVMSYDFTMQGGSDANVGSVGVFVAGRADAAITVNVVNGGPGTYKIVAG